MLLIAFDRFDTIFRLQKKHVKQVYLRYALSIPAVLTISLIPVALLLYGIDDREVEYCTISVNWNKKFGMFTFIEMIIYNITILTLYAIIFLLYHHKTKNLANVPRNRFQSIVYGVVVIYLLTWCIPKWIVFGLKIAKADRAIVSWFSVVAGILEVFSACLNVIVYGYTHRDLRKTMRKFCLRKFGYSIPRASQFSTKVKDKSATENGVYECCVEFIDE